MRYRAAVIVTVGFLACAPVRADDAAPVAPETVAPVAAPAAVEAPAAVPAPVADPAPINAPEAAAPQTPATDATAPAVVTAEPAPAVVPAPRPAPVAARAAPQSDDSPAPLDDVAFDATFQCPETLASAESRMAEVARYFAWTKLRHPDWGFRKRLDVRYGLLRRHACASTLASIAASARPPFRH